MHSSANAAIFEAFSDDVDKILDNELKFKDKLEIGDKAFSYLSNAKNLRDFGEAGTIGVGTAAIVSVAWWSSLGIIGKTALVLGLSSTPLGWIAGAGIGGTIGAFGIKKIFKKADKAAMHKIPKFLNKPIDAVAMCVAQLLFPPAVRIACSDNDFCTEEKDLIVNFFVNDYGFNEQFVINQVDLIGENVEAIDYKALRQNIESACNVTHGLDKEVIIKDLIMLLQEVTQADGKIVPTENNELEYAKTILTK